MCISELLPSSVSASTLSCWFGTAGFPPFEVAACLGAAVRGRVFAVGVLIWLPLTFPVDAQIENARIGRNEFGNERIKNRPRSLGCATRIASDPWRPAHHFSSSHASLPSGDRKLCWCFDLLRTRPACNLSICHDQIEDIGILSVVKSALKFVRMERHARRDDVIVTEPASSRLFLIPLP